MVISDTTFISDSTLFLRDLLGSKVTDPISSSRTSGNNFVMTSYPERKVQYPLITIVCNNVSGDRDGMRSEGMNLNMIFEIRAWAKDVRQRDVLAQGIVTALRQNQTDDSTGTIANNLFNMRLLSAVNVDEPGENGVHSKVLEYGYKVFIDG